MTWVEIVVCFIGIFVLFHFGVDEAIKLFKFSETVAKQLQKSKIRYILLFWLWCLFIASCLNSWMIWKYILGVIIISRSLLAIAKNLIQEVQQLEWFLIVEFMLAMIVSCYLIYTIPDDNLQNIILTITAAIIGGLITLMGVAWTIKHTNKDRQLANKRFQYDKKLEGYQLVLEIYRNVESGKSKFINKDRKASENILRSCPHCTPFITNSPNFESVQNIIQTPLLDEPKRSFLFKKDWLEQKAIAFKMMFYNQSKENAILVFNFMMSYRKTLECLHQTFVVWYNIWKEQEEKNQQGSALDGDYVDKYLSDNEEDIELKKNIELLYQYYFEIQEKNILDWIEQQIMI